MNPLIGAMGKPPMNDMNAMMQTISNVRQMIQGKNPEAFMQMFAQKNPQFARFLQENQGKTPQQIAEAYGLDWNMIQQFLR